MREKKRKVLVTFSMQSQSMQCFARILLFLTKPKLKQRSGCNCHILARHMKSWKIPPLFTLPIFLALYKPCRDNRVLVGLPIAAPWHFWRDGLGVGGIVGHYDRERLRRVVAAAVAAFTVLVVHDHDIRLR